MSASQGMQEVSHLFLDIKGPSLSPEGHSRGVGRLLRNSRLVIAQISRNVFSVDPYEAVISKSVVLLAEKNKGIAIGDVVPGTSSKFIERLFVIDDVSLVAISQSGTIFLMRVFGVPYKKYTAEATAVVEGPLLPSLLGVVDLFLPLEDVYLKNRDITVVRFGLNIFEGIVIKESHPATIILSSLNTGISVGFPIPKTESNPIAHVFPVSSDKVIAITESGAMYFIADREKNKRK